MYVHTSGLSPCLYLAPPLNSDGYSVQDTNGFPPPLYMHFCPQDPEYSPADIQYCDIVPIGTVCH